MTTPRYPLAPLAQALTIDAARRGDPPPGRDTIAAILDVSDTTIETWRTEGIPATRRAHNNRPRRTHITDDYAIATGRHPTQLWPNWGHDELEERLADDFYSDDPPLHECPTIDPHTLARWHPAPMMDTPWPPDESPTTNAQPSSRPSKKPRTSERPPAGTDETQPRSAASPRQRASTLRNVA